MNPVNQWRPSLIERLIGLLPGDYVYAYWRHRSFFDEEIDRLPHVRWARAVNAAVGNGVDADTGTIQPTAEQLREIRPVDAADRRISPDRLVARDHTPADRPGHRVAPDPTDEEVTVDG